MIDLASGKAPRHPKELKKLEQFTALHGNSLASFLKLLHFEDRQDDYWEQRNILFQNVNGYLPDADVDAPIRLKELVTRRALSESIKNPIINREDVLRALGADECQLFPAPCLIERLNATIPRAQEPDLMRTIIEASAPVVVHASAGVGKTVFATRIASGLPSGSTCILYDCFGNGQYRNASGYRHRHKDALVQIANEIAAKGFCHPLIPTSHADASSYMRVFVHRINQAANILRLTTPHALLGIVIDAADNAQMAAEEIGEKRSFVRDLIREKMPDNVRLVFLCRSHRQTYLEPPVDAIRCELEPFTREETSTHLRQSFEDATERDIDEFHRLSSHNPRVQALAISQNMPLHEILRRLGPNPTTVEKTIGCLLENAVAHLKDNIGPDEKKQVDKICSGLAVLRPPIPILILSQMSNVDKEAIKSFAIDIGRPLRLLGDNIQFFDEPAETWFREKFKPPVSVMSKFIASMTSLAAKSAYVASVLPQLMLEAGDFSELVHLALTAEVLPETSVLEKQEIELQRLQFALKAALRLKRYPDAAKLALKTGGEMAGDDRRRKILQSNTDLAAEFLETGLIQEIASRGIFRSGWVGSHNAYEAALLSWRPELIGDARSRLRMADDWLHNWSRLPTEEREKEKISDQDIAELTFTHLNIHGSKSGAYSLRRWYPREISFRAGRIVARRLIDHGRFNDLELLASAAGNNFYLVLAITVALREMQRVLPIDIIRRVFRLVAYKRIKLGDGDYAWGERESVINSVTALIEAGLQHAVCTADEAAKVLTRYLPNEPQRAFSSRFTKARFPVLRAYCLRAALQGHTLELRDLAHPELRAEIDKKNQHSGSREFQEFKEDIGALLPWHQLWASILLGRITKVSLDNELKQARDTSNSAMNQYYSDNFNTINEIALMWIDILCLLNAMDDSRLEAFFKWKDSLKGSLFTPTLTAIARLFGQKKETRKTALKFALETFNLTKEERSDAEIKSGSYIEAARAILIVSKEYAKELFGEAVEVTSKIGDEVFSRWNAILDLADRAARDDRPTPEIAYYLARCAELTRDYIDDSHFDWKRTVESLCGLCPSSALAILSRWRDRGFGWSEEILPTAVERLIERGNLDARDALPLVSYRAQWAYEKLLDNALKICTTQNEKEAIAAYLYRYMQFSSGDFSELKKVAASHGIAIADIDKVISFNELEKSANKSPGYVQIKGSQEVLQKATLNWDEVFADCDLGNAEGLLQAYAAFKNTDSPCHDDQFFKEAIRRVPIGSEPAFIKAVGDISNFSLYDLRYFLEQIPDEWTKRPAITHALEDMLKFFCRRYCMKITKNKYYEELSLNRACMLVGVSEDEVIGIVLDAVGETPDFADANRLFSLISLLAIKLSEDDALDALTFGLDLFKPVLEDKDGDGPWSSKLIPPSDIKVSLAGYIWASMAAPEAVLRWEGAHAVAGIAALGRQDILRHLFKFATEKNGGVFVDGRLAFYGLHALQWFLIGIARAATEFPREIAPFADQIVTWAINNQPHILIRQFAARAALALISNGLLADKDNLKARLSKINISPFPFVESKLHERNGDKENGIISGNGYLGFNYDIGCYWYKPLGHVFALSQEEVKAEALKVVRTELGFTGTGRWDEDERNRRKLYKERHAYHSHGSYPRIDTLSFYYAYHAMMIVAGKFLSIMPVHCDSLIEEEDEFSDWFERHDLSRKDGRWLWDRRDPSPCEWPAWKNRENDEEMRRIITEKDFDETLYAGELLNIWGSWTTAASKQEQSVHVSSALVSPDKSTALLRALNTTRNIHDYAIPSAGSDMEIDESGFILKGWIVDNSKKQELDDQDRWAGDINWPPPMPAQYIIDLMEIETDLDCRLWHDESGVIVIASQVWGHYDESAYHEVTNPERGNRLKASLSFMTTLLSKLDCDLIIKVQIDRCRRYSPYERNKDEEEKDRIPVQARLYLLRKDGRIHTL